MRVIAKDRDGIPRVWGEGLTTDQAIHECHTALYEYLESHKVRGFKLSDFTMELAD